jgi:CheY-like chemotaxis protein
MGDDVSPVSTAGAMDAPPSIPAGSGVAFIPPSGRRTEDASLVADPGSRGPVDRRRTRARILLVDDMEDQRELYREYLLFAGFDVAVARDGYEAVDEALRTRPDVVIMDLAMPGLDGFEATQRLKTLDATRSIPVIALTAHGSLPREWALSAGCAAYVKKPCYPHDLAEQITAVMDRAPHARPGADVPAGAPLRAHVLVLGGPVAERELYAEYLEYRGCIVSVNADGKRSVPDAHRLRPRVIVLDLDGTRPAGWSVLRDLRQDSATRDIPVIGITRHAGAAEREQARDLDATLLAKPCEPDALYREIKKAMTSGSDPN